MSRMVAIPYITIQMSPLLPCDEVGSEEETVMVFCKPDVIWLGVMYWVSDTGIFSVPATDDFCVNVSISLYVTAIACYCSYPTATSFSIIATSFLVMMVMSFPFWTTVSVRLIVVPPAVAVKVMSFVRSIYPVWASEVTETVWFPSDAPYVRYIFSPEPSPQLTCVVIN